MTNETHQLTTNNVDETVLLGNRLGSALRGGEVIELHSDVGGGKTTLIKGLAAGMGYEDAVQSPTFIVGAVYRVPSGLELHHYDFYRIHDPGIMREQLSESLDNPQVVTTIEWSDIVQDVLPDAVMKVAIRADSTDDTVRHFEFTLPEGYDYLKQAITT